MKLLSASSIHKWEELHVEKYNYSFEKLMHQASIIISNWIDKKFVRDNMSVAIICGWGNNGGDGYATGQILLDRNVKVQIYRLIEGEESVLCKKMRKAFKGKILKIHSIVDLKNLPSYDLVIDSILGIGCNRAFSIELEKIIQFINKSSKHIMSIDIPSGMRADSITESISINAQETCTFSIPKLSYFSSTNEMRLGHWIVKSIDLDHSLLSSLFTNYYYLTKNFFNGKMRKRPIFSHKGTFGHVLLIGGSLGKAGAICLSAKAALKSGCGLVSIGTCEMNRIIVQSSLNEAMYLACGKNIIDQFLFPADTFSAVGIGPGLGTNHLTINAFGKFIIEYKQRLVLDADALNIVSKLHLLDSIHKGSIITPHPKEFDRLFGISNNDFERRDKQLLNSKKYGLYIILKGAYTSISTPDGNLYYNSTGSSSLATGGTGDVLTGMICSYLAQGYDPLLSCQIAVFLHGLCGEIAEKSFCAESVIASDIIKFIPQAIKMTK